MHSFAWNAWFTGVVVDNQGKMLPCGQILEPFYIPYSKKGAGQRSNGTSAEAAGFSVQM